MDEILIFKTFWLLTNKMIQNVKILHEWRISKLQIISEIGKINIFCSKENYFNKFFELWKITE